MGKLGPAKVNECRVHYPRATRLWSFEWTDLEFQPHLAVDVSVSMVGIGISSLRVVLRFSQVVT